MVKENIVVGKGTEYPLKGILTLPDDTSGPVPAVVLVHGSGASNMDEKVGKLVPFRDIADGLAELGIASIRYDKRSFAHGFKLIRDKNRPVTVKTETIEDAILATEILKKDKRIDPEKVFIIGHSMGGMLAPRIDTEGGDYCGLIIMAGTPRRLEEVMKDQLKESLSAMGTLMRRLSEKSVKKLTDKFEGLYEMTDEQARRVKMSGGTTLYYFKEMGDPPVSYYLEKTSKPMLIMQGEKDFQVRADKDFALYKEILKSRDNVTFRLYENLNHAFVDAVYDSISMAKKEYNTERHIGRTVIKDIAEFININSK